MCFSILLSSFETDAQVHAEEMHVDANAYHYTTSTNDPTGLRTYKLKNGLTVYLAQDFDAPSINYIMAVRAGSAYDPKDNTGLAHYLEHLLFNGTRKLGTLDGAKEQALLIQIEKLYDLHKKENSSERKKTLYKQIDSLSFEASKYGIKGEYRAVLNTLGGVGTNGTTNFENIIYGTVIPAPSLEQLLRLEKERFSDPSFRAFNTELEIVYEEFNSMQDNDFIQKYFAANKVLFPTHPYGQQTVIGTSEHLKNPSITAIRKYFKTYYVPNNMALILVGNLDFDKTIRAADRAFGGLKPTAIKRPLFPKEAPLKKITVVELTNPGPSAAFIGFRMKGIGSEDEKYLSLINKMLDNNTAGIINTDPVSPQKLKTANSFMFLNNDYSMHFLNGTPREGQSLEDVKDQLLSSLDKIKKGDFDDWLIEACAKDLKREFLKEITENQNLDFTAATAFIHFESWNKRLSFYDALSHVSKKELVDFTNRTYINDYVVVYKKQGPASSVVKVENPGITPILLNEDKHSSWATKFTSVKVPATKAAFVDYKKEIRYDSLRNGLLIASVKNKLNDLFQLDCIFDFGKNADKNIQLAVNYINYAGTTRFTAPEWKKEFYKLGLSVNFTAQNNQTIFHLEGLEESLEKGYGCWIIYSITLSLTSHLTITTCKALLIPVQLT
ncbi:MAG: insulinase family protein [Chitinophagaceae bacterium]|nr:insulinase family protein [Chitinophagaceae bacterium]